MKSFIIQISLLVATHLCGLPLFANQQNSLTPTILKNAAQHFTLEECINYALSNQPNLNKSSIGIDIAKKTNAIALSTWLPQIDVTGNLIHYLQLGTVANPNATFPQNIQNRFSNTFIPQLSASQTLFNPSALYALKSAPSYIKQAEQISDSTKINLIATVTKSFYSLLLTMEQINVLKEDTTRLNTNMQDAYHRYKSGIVDETDYEQANIALNNSKAQLMLATENIKPRYATLKQLMGFPAEEKLTVSFDTLQMIKNIYIDTTQQLHYDKRIEYQQIKTQRELQHQLKNYYRFAFLPTASVFYNYNLGFQSNQLATLFDSHSPTSLIGLSLSIPIFKGLSRINNLQKANLQEKLINWNEVDIKSQINKEYETARASYKSNLYNFEVLKKNVSLAKRVYFVVDLQYKQGIIAYLNLITAESNLITAQINYLNALFQVLSSKIDLQKAMGLIQ